MAQEQIPDLGTNCERNVYMSELLRINFIQTLTQVTNSTLAGINLPAPCPKCVSQVTATLHLQNPIKYFLQWELMHWAFQDKY